MRIRGISSILGSAQPLYVVDGVIVSDVSIGNGTNKVTGAAGNAISGEGIQNAMSYLSDNVILLTTGGDDRTRRAVRVLKTRGSAHDTRVREVEITAAGLAVLP